MAPAKWVPAGLTADQVREINAMVHVKNELIDEAIGRVLAAAKSGDCVVIAGKGHETTQEFADTVVPFDDRQIVREILELRRGAQP